MSHVVPAYERDRPRSTRGTYDGVPALYPALPSALQARSRPGLHFLWAGKAKERVYDGA